MKNRKKIFLVLLLLAGVATIAASKVENLHFFANLGITRKPVAHKVPFTGQLTGSAAVVIDGNSGQMIYAKKAQKPLPMASTTKMMTALLALEAIPLDTIVEVGSEVKWTAADESKAGLKGGQKLTWHHLIEAMLLASGNDAARTIAVQVGLRNTTTPGTKAQALQLFVDLMNKKARELGLRHTHFMNPHGMDDAQHYSTAQDLAHLALEAMKNNGFREIVRIDQATIPTVEHDKEVDLPLKNTNRLLRKQTSNYYEGTIGIKTGYTSKAGSCLVSSAQRDGKIIISVVLHSTKRKIWQDAHQLLNHGFTWVEAQQEHVLDAQALAK